MRRKYLARIVVLFLLFFTMGVNVSAETKNEQLNYNLEQNIADIKNQVKEMKEYVEHFGKFKVGTYNLWDIVRDVFKKTEKIYNVIWNYNCQDKPMVILSKGMFEEWVLENIGGIKHKNINVEREVLYLT